MGFIDINVKLAVDSYTIFAVQKSQLLTAELNRHLPKSLS
jgi:hypothetical protein